MFNRKTLDDEKKAVRDKYHVHAAASEVADVDLRASRALKVSAEVEYAKTFGFWGGFYKVDRALAGFTGVALTKNTQKLLDAEVLSRTLPAATTDAPVEGAKAPTDNTEAPSSPRV